MGYDELISETFLCFHKKNHWLNIQLERNVASIIRKPIFHDDSILRFSCRFISKGIGPQLGSSIRELKIYKGKLMYLIGFVN